MNNSDKTEIEELKDSIASIKDELKKMNKNLESGNPLAAIFKSKKGLALVAAIGLTALKQFGVDIDNQEFIGILSLLGVYITGQGIADHGKERAKIENKKPNQ